MGKAEKTGLFYFYAKNISVDVAHETSASPYFSGFLRELGGTRDTLFTRTPFAYGLSGTTDRWRSIKVWSVYNRVSMPTKHPGSQCWKMRNRLRRTPTSSFHYWPRCQHQPGVHQRGFQRWIGISSCSIHVQTAEIIIIVIWGSVLFVFHPAF